VLFQVHKLGTLLTFRASQGSTAAVEYAVVVTACIVAPVNDAGTIHACMGVRLSGERVVEALGSSMLAEVVAKPLYL
jgi:hypothetical protein